ncbi:hydroxymethylglutaryl-CoA reductase [Aquisalimonas asiatica]|uniref:hydroxymethylglutaryl-CoA reductase (NADPH) n=1 Tax=Aquisalimonas asiatica TaxID=406100 RepID=A0A1H8Q2B4_9GAMM|nr:hydroxymethylglutaryl-CoA reductase [Aquisalimonas asiatica]SEO48121.1 3-hydroxy-3-methylglutaryl-coenzyme A reductase [Aquisalimonas asiatica]
MATDHAQANAWLRQLLAEHSAESLHARLSADHTPSDRRLPLNPRTLERLVERRWQATGNDSDARAQLLDDKTVADMGAYEANIENFIGTVKLPVGLAGPLRVNGLFAQGDYHVPLATSEAALVASYSRGAQLITAVGGCTAMVIDEGVSRAPGFAFDNLRDAGEFVAWALQSLDALRAAGEATTRHGRLRNLRVTIEGNHVYLNFEFSTGEASGQNMVTIATEAICAYVMANAPVTPRYHFVEANHSGDKKASAQSFIGVRGRKVTAEVHIPGEHVRKALHTTPEAMVDYWRMSAMGGVMSGTIGVHGHYANGLAALYIACGQDAACVAESAVGVTRFEQTDTGLYAAVTLPNLMVGTIGGGTSLPSQNACLRLLGLDGPGSAHALAEVAAALSLAGELSIIGALCSGHFSRAHEVLARVRNNT